MLDQFERHNLCDQMAAGGGGFEPAEHVLCSQTATGGIAGILSSILGPGITGGDVLGLFGSLMALPEFQTLMNEQSWAWNQQQNAANIGTNPSALAGFTGVVNQGQLNNTTGNVGAFQGQGLSQLEQSIAALNNPQMLANNAALFNNPNALAQSMATLNNPQMLAANQAVLNNPQQLNANIQALQTPMSQNLINSITAPVTAQVGASGLATSPMMTQYALGQALAPAQLQLQQLASQMGLSEQQMAGQLGAGVQGLGYTAGQNLNQMALQAGESAQGLGYSAGTNLQSLASSLGMSTAQLAAQLSQYGLGTPFNLGTGVAGGSPALSAFG